MFDQNDILRWVLTWDYKSDILNPEHKNVLIKRRVYYVTCF